MPRLHAGALLVLGDSVKDFPQPINAVGRQVNRHSDGVHNPVKDEIYGVPAAVSFAQLLGGYQLAAGWGIF